MSNPQTTKPKYYDGLHMNTIAKIISIAFFCGREDKPYQEAIDEVKGYIEKFLRQA